jgi:hypothetical protein
MSSLTYILAYYIKMFYHAAPLINSYCFSVTYKIKHVVSNMTQNEHGFNINVEISSLFLRPMY